VHNLALDASQIDWVVKGADDSVVAVVESVSNRITKQRSKTDP
jgi:hypothetical protein